MDIPNIACILHHNVACDFGNSLIAQTATTLAAAAAAASTTIDSSGLSPLFNMKLNRNFHLLT